MPRETPTDLVPSPGYSDRPADTEVDFDLRALVTDVGIMEVVGMGRRIVIGARATTGEVIGVLLDDDDLDAVAALTRYLRIDLADA